VKKPGQIANYAKNQTMNDQSYIPGIYNYCDSWCERCPFTRQCRSFDPRQETSDSDSKESILETLHDSLQEAMDSLRNHVEQQGLDWEVFQKEAANTAIPKPDSTQHQDLLVEIAKEYSTSAQKWLEVHQDTLRARGNELTAQLHMGLDVMERGVQLADSLEVIQWYLFFIQAKLQRAIRSFNEDDVFDADPIQNDANGSAKVALLAIENSMAAWEIVRDRFPEMTNSILDLLLLLARLRAGIDQEFVHARSFIRPGFDEVSG
jgi:hypothetical protein